MRQLECLMERNLKNVEACLSDTGRELLQKYRDCTLEYLALCNEQAFCDGFCLGAKLTAEALTLGEALA